MRTIFKYELMDGAYCNAKWWLKLNNFRTPKNKLLDKQTLVRASPL